MEKLKIYRAFDRAFDRVSGEESLFVLKDNAECAVSDYQGEDDIWLKCSYESLIQYIYEGDGRFKDAIDPVLVRVVTSEGDVEINNEQTKTSKLKKLSDWFWNNAFLIISIIWLIHSTLEWIDGMTINFLICGAISSVFLCTDSIIKEIKGKK